MAFKFTILNSVHPIMLCAMFGMNWICGSEEVKYVKKNLQTGRWTPQSDQNRLVAQVS